VGSLDHAAAEIPRFGIDAEVLAPAELRNRIAEIVSALANTYQQ
jgi:hypothetical protein